MTNDETALRSLLVRQPRASAEAVAAEAQEVPRATAERPNEHGYDDWRERLARNLSRRSDGPWEPLTYFDDVP